MNCPSLSLPPPITDDAPIASRACGFRTAAAAARRHPLAGAAAAPAAGAAAAAAAGGVSRRTDGRIDGFLQRLPRGTPSAAALARQHAGAAAAMGSRPATEGELQLDLLEYANQMVGVSGCWDSRWALVEQRCG